MHSFAKPPRSTRPRSRRRGAGGAGWRVRACRRHVVGHAPVARIGVAWQRSRWSVWPSAAPMELRTGPFSPATSQGYRSDLRAPKTRQMLFEP